jgi:hypothetical protein
VRKIFRLYDDLGCLNAVMRRANDLGLRSKLHRFKSGRSRAEIPSRAVRFTPCCATRFISA